MSDPHPRDDNHETATEIESMIRAAGNYIRPSEDLRPRTLEAARRHCGDRRAEQRLGSFVIAVMLLVTFSPPAIQCAHLLRAQAVAPSAAAIQERAIEYASYPEIGHHWGLAEAFSQLRRVQATRLGQSTGAMK